MVIETTTFQSDDYGWFHPEPTLAALLPERMRFPNNKPKEDPGALWSLQASLLAFAEDQLGPRDSTKKIYQPQFTDQGPMLRNTPKLDGAYAELSRGAENFWSTALFELAHETVHLLDPSVGNTNYFEEGIAVRFSLWLAPNHSAHVRESNSAYFDALRMVEQISESPIETAKLARERFGALNKVSGANLNELCPNADPDLLVKLVQEFI